MRESRGVSLVELLVALAVASIIMAITAGLLVQNSRLNKAQQLRVEVQQSARGCLGLVAKTLRTAGWDPRNVGFSPLAFDPDPSDEIDQIETFADLSEDGDLDDEGESVLIRHVADRLEWRTSSDTSAPFEVLAVNITNDADGDGVPEPMFTPDSTTEPRSVSVTITARSPVEDPTTGGFIRYTVRSEVYLRSP